MTKNHLRTLTLSATVTATLLTALTGCGDDATGTGENPSSSFTSITMNETGSTGAEPTTTGDTTTGDLPTTTGVDPTHPDGSASDSASTGDQTTAGHVCGDGILDPNEKCDDGPSNSDQYSHMPKCNATCSGPAPHCGDGTIQDKYENCEGFQIEGVTCESLDYTGGNLKCDPTTCQPDISECWACGDGIVSGPEICDDGNLNTNNYHDKKYCNLTCSGFNPHCSDGILQDDFEACDGEIFEEGAHCTNGGILKCDPLGCILDKSECAPCGNGVLDPGEVCDQGALNTNAYHDQKRCNFTCSGYNPHCDDGILQDDFEACDGEIFEQGLMCKMGGILKCVPGQCIADKSGCL